MQAIASPPPDGQGTADLLRQQRAALGEAAIDKLMSGIPNAAYPATTLESLLHLIGTVESSGLPYSRITPIIYYFFLDYPPAATNGASVADHYGVEVKLCDELRAHIRGLWALDRQLIDQNVISDLTEMPLEKDWAEWTLGALKPNPELYVAFVDSQQPEQPNSNDFIESLIKIGQYSRALQVGRTTDNLPHVFELLAKEISTSSAAARGIAQLGCSPDEWHSIESFAEQSVLADPTGLAGTAVFVRAMHTGDIEAVHKMKSLSDRYASMSRGVAEL